MGFITLGSGHKIHASQLSDLNPPGSIEVTAFNEKTGKWDVIVPKDVNQKLDTQLADLVKIR